MTAAKLTMLITAQDLVPVSRFTPSIDIVAGRLQGTVRTFGRGDFLGRLAASPDLDDVHNGMLIMAERGANVTLYRVTGRTIGAVLLEVVA